MAHKLNDIINKIEKRKSTPCNNTCEYYRFPHLERACILSEVYSVRKGELCFEYKAKEATKK